MRIENQGLSESVVPGLVSKDKALDYLDLQTKVGSLNHVFSLYQSLPAIRGFWPFFNGSVVNPNLFALSPTGDAGNPQWSRSGLFQYTNFDASDNQALTSSSVYLYPEASIAWTDQEGMAVGCWVRFTSLGSTQEMGIISNWVEFGNERCFLLAKTSGDQFQFAVSSDGSAETTISGYSVAIDTWYFVAGVYNPSTEIRLFVYDGTNINIYSNTTSIPASLNAPSTSAFAIGRATGSASGTDYLSLDGDACLSFFTPNDIVDYWIELLRATSEPYVLGAR